MIILPITLDPFWWLKRRPSPEPPANELLAQIARMGTRLDQANEKLAALGVRLESAERSNSDLVTANIEQARMLRGLGATLDRERQERHEDKERSDRYIGSLEGRLSEAENGRKSQGVRIRKLEEDHAALQAQYDLAMRDLKTAQRKAEYWIAVAQYVDKSYQTETGRPSLIDTEQAAKVSALIGEEQAS